jgi:ATP-dependent DNA ligase
MLAKRVSVLPEQGEWLYEPKWDGFRAIVFRDGDEVVIQSRDLKPLNRYFPDLLDPLKVALPRQCVLDGEIVIQKDGVLDFEELQLRIHPAASRVAMLAEQSPASVVFFDLLCEGKHNMMGHALAERRIKLEAVLANAGPPVHLTPATRERSVAEDWFRRFEGAGLDGVVTKPLSGHYEPDKRVMLKVKHERDCDCVVAGFRWHKDGDGTALGSLLLGLYDQADRLQHVGVCASFTAEKRRELVQYLAPYREGALVDHPWKSVVAPARTPGGKSRWSKGKDLSWEPLRPELVAEVAYEHMQGPRFRHMAHFRRWRVDKRARVCTYEQLEVVAPHELAQIFSGGR